MTLMTTTNLYGRLINVSHSYVCLPRSLCNNAMFFPAISTRQSYNIIYYINIMILYTASASIYELSPYKALPLRYIKRRCKTDTHIVVISNMSPKQPFHQGLFWSRQYPILFVGRSAHFCENSREPASTVEHYPISSGKYLVRLPQSSEVRVLTLRRHYARPVRARQSLYESPIGRARQGTFGGPSDDQDDQGTTIFDRLLFFNMFKKQQPITFRGDSGRQLGRTKK